MEREHGRTRKRLDRKPRAAPPGPAPKERAAAPPRAAAAPAAQARTLARTLGDQRARSLMAGSRPAAPAAPLAITAPGDAAEREADRAADAVTRAAPAQVRRDEAGAGPGVAPPIVHDVLASGGRPLEAGTRERMEEGLGADLGGVRVHTDGQAAESARAVNANAYTVGNDVVFGEGRYAPGSREGDRLLAHELAHVVQQGGGAGAAVVQRQTPAELKASFMDMGGLNLREDDLGRELARRARGGEFGFVLQVMDLVEDYNRDEVADYMIQDLLGGGTVSSAREVIRISNAPGGRAFLESIYGYLGYFWESEVVAGRMVGAVLDKPGDRFAWNRRRIREIKEGAPTDLEALARIFEDDLVVDDGTPSGRLRSILDATENLVVPGLQTGVEFSDTGFAGDQNPGGAGFRDPHPSSRNQPGHFLTAVGLQFSPGVVSRPIPFFGTIRQMVEAPESMSDADVAVRLTIGHEKAADPWPLMAGVNVLLSGVVESVLPGPEGETEEEENERVGRVMVEETRRQIAEIIRAFRTQFRAATDADVAAWNEAQAAMGTGPQLDMAAAEAPLRRIAIDPTLRGNSIQDLRLSAVGWRLGQLIGAGAFASGAAVAAWIRANLGSPSPPGAQRGGSGGQ
ncbi:MAG TPA: DUF4157 domain-containing protein [Longimicrobium sp.]|nr:DUF4157 domain-containing protein [Longimicrobium sp.]